MDLRTNPADVRTEDGYIRATMPAPASDCASEIRRKRLLFRSWHRGTREADLILGSFAEAHLRDFDAGGLDQYEALLACPDPDLFDWIAGRATPPPEYDTDVTRLLLTFRYTPRPT
jgi:antitoxin CptB